MRVLTSLPLLGELLSKVFERIWPDKNNQMEKSLDIELEEVRQSRGRPTPRMLLRDIVASVLAMFLILTFCVGFFPVFGPLPEWVNDRLPLAGTLFGVGG